MGNLIEVSEKVDKSFDIMIETIDGPRVELIIGGIIVTYLEHRQMASAPAEIIIRFSNDVGRKR